MTADAIQRWIGSTRKDHDVVTAGVLDRWSATVTAELGCAPTGDRGLAPCAHWALCLPSDHQLAADGHPPTGDFLPPVALPTRMWAGGRVEWRLDLRIGERVDRTSTVTAIQPKTGASGELVFVTVEHELSTSAGVAIWERQDIVYRERRTAGPAPRPPGDAGAAAPADRRHTVIPTEPWLFRFSALTFNAHRIHYDRAYATGVEGYAGLVVHGPLLAALMATLAAEHAAESGRSLRSMEYRASQPVTDATALDVCVRRTSDEAIEAWIEVDGQRCSAATITVG
jgi:3-methylfumaryl-CoA hydratase